MNRNETKGDSRAKVRARIRSQLSAVFSDDVLRLLVEAIEGAAYDLVWDDAYDCGHRAGLETCAEREHRCKP